LILLSESELKPAIDLPFKWVIIGMTLCVSARSETQQILPNWQTAKTRRLLWTRQEVGTLRMHCVAAGMHIHQCQAEIDRARERNRVDRKPMWGTRFTRVRL